MKIALIAAATAFLVGSTVAAFAVDDTGTITQINWGVGTITLDNGDTYVIPPNVQSTGAISVGDKVKVTYEDKVASAVTKAS